MKSGGTYPRAPDPYVSGESNLVDLTKESDKQKQDTDVKRIILSRGIYQDLFICLMRTRHLFHAAQVSRSQECARNSTARIKIRQRYCN